MTEFSMTIGGEAAPTVSTFEVIDPATGAPFASAPECTREQLDQAFAAAAEAQRSWRRDEGARRKALLAVADAVEAAAEEDGPLLSHEQGKPLRDAKQEFHTFAAWVRYYANLDIPTEIVRDDEKARTEVVRRPLGVVAAITPWNFPITLVSWKLAPALLAGNTMVLKPSPYTPLATLRVGEILRGVLPPGVFNVVSGGDELGSWMTSHPVPRKVSFTGSVATGKKVATSAGPDLKRVTLELGGNDPAIILDDADPQKVAEQIFWKAFGNCGQVCAAVKRVYVPAQMHDQVVDVFAELARTVKVGPGTQPDVQLGPINNKPQFERVKELVADAISSGAKAVAGGGPRQGDGYFFEPTILTGVSDGVRIVDEEQFGPALPVIPYTDLDDAVERANNTLFGLSGSVWGSDGERAAQVAAQLECGTSFVNQHMGTGPASPFGGLKHSGLGVENGPWGYYAFTDIQVLHRAK